MAKTASPGPTMIGFSSKQRGWRDALSEAYFRLSVTPQDTEAVDGRIIKKSYANLGFTRFKAPALTVTRTRRHIAADTIEQFCLVFVRAGSCKLSQRSTEITTTRNGMYIVNASEPYMVQHSAGTEMSCLAVPCDLLRPRVQGIDDMIIQADYADGMVAAAIQNLVEKAIVTARVTADERVEALCLDMIALMLGAKAGVTDR